jgi:RNA polymerase sigma factor (sigma-70 family)
MDPDTSIGGHRDRFPETRRSALIDIQSDVASLRDGAREAFIAAYWKPVYKDIRIRWKQSNEDAKDLTQAFFARALEKEFFGAYDPARAGFRTYLRTCLDGFVSNEQKSDRRLKRGGDALLVSLDFETADGEIRQHEIPSGQSPEEYFHQEWVREIFAIAVDALRRECDERGKLTAFRLFERYDLEPHSDETPRYDDLAREFEIAATTVTNHLAAMRRRFRQIVLETLRANTVSENEFRNEARAILGIEA